MTRTQQRPRWGSLTSELEVTAGPPRRLLAAAVPLLREVQADYRESVGPIRVPPGPANPGTLGTAFGVWVELQAWPRPALHLASRGAFAAGPGIGVAFGQLLHRLGSQGPTGDGPVEGTWTGPSADLTGRDLLRLCWAAACMIEVVRTGTVMPGSPLALLPTDSPDDLLALASPGAVDELSDLVELARERLLPPLRALTSAGPTWLGPVFAGSTTMSADADVIVGRTLVELKTLLGAKTPKGRRASLDMITLNQMLGYVLHDTDDDYRLTSVALYQARYGHLAIWDLGRLLHRLGGHPVDLAALRDEWAAMLAQGPGRRD